MVFHSCGTFRRSVSCIVAEVECEFESVQLYELRRLMFQLQILNRT
jgi:hypothetical protein